MSARFVHIDHGTPLLLPPDLRDWVPRRHMVHLIMDAVSQLDVSAARVNHRGTGGAQYPPGTMLGLWIYSSAAGVFSSRAIERSTYENVAVRLLCADTHPDHDTGCAFRRANEPLLRASFAQVLAMAVRCGVLKVGGITVAIDGPKVLANASQHAAISSQRAGAQMRELDLETEALLAKAEVADATPLDDGLSIPDEVQPSTWEPNCERPESPPPHEQRRHLHLETAPGPPPKSPRSPTRHSSAGFSNRATFRTPQCAKS